MKAPNITKGPWEIGPVSARGDTTIVAKSKRGLTKALCYLAGFFKDEREANAKLISAAPDLAEALLAFVENSSVAVNQPDEHERARAALLKAGYTED